jgi:hemerythrin-like domain-containing protein
MSQQPVFQALHQDHAQILSQMKALEEAIRALLPATPPQQSHHLDECRERLRGLRQTFLVHRCREEVGLFPDVERMVAHGLPKVDRVAGFFAGEAEDDIRAHLAVENSLRKMADLLDALKPEEVSGEGARAELLDTAERTHRLLRRHAGKEEDLVFPLIGRLLSEDQIAAVAARMRELCRGLDDQAGTA